MTLKTVLSRLMSDKNIDAQIFEVLEKPTIGRRRFPSPDKISSALVNEARFVYVLNGKSKLHSPDVTLELKAGDSFVMKCENFVNNWLVDENNPDARNGVIAIIFYPDVLRYIYDDHLPPLFFTSTPVQVKSVEMIDKNEALDHFIKDLQYYFDNPQHLQEEMIKIKIRELIYVLVNSDKTGRIKTILGDLFKTAEHKFKEVIHQNLFEDLTLDDYAFLCNMSLSSFKRKFKEIYEQSPRQYITHRRLQKAQELLITSELHISEVAYDSGYNDAAYFTKSFSQAFGLSPKEYRNQHLNQNSK